jgi:hypothetical protein
VAGVGQQRLVRLHQRLDAVGGAVEAGGDGGDLVAAAIVDALLQVAGAELLDAALQAFEPAREAAHHRPRAGGDGDEQQHQHDGQADAAADEPRRRPQHHAVRRRRVVGAGARRALAHAHVAGTEAAQPQHAAVGQRDRADAAAGVAFGFLARERCGRGDALAVGGVQRERHPQPGAPVEQCGALLVERRGRGRKAVFDQRGPGGHALGRRGTEVLALGLQVALREPARDEREHQQHRDDGEVDAEVEALHAAVGVRPGRRVTRRPACARRCSRRRAR